MPSHRLRAFIALAFVLVALTPAHAIDPPFEVFALTTGVSLGPGEGDSFSVQVVRHTETCTACTSGSTTCCTGQIQLTFENVPAGVTACFPLPNGQCGSEIVSDGPGAVLQADSTIVPGTYTLHVRARANDGPNPRSHSADVTLTLLPFSVHVPPSASLLPGGSQSLALSIERIAAGAGAIDFALVSPEAGLSGTFSPNAGDQAALQLSAAPSLPPGNYFPSVRATLGTVVRSYGMNVAVAPLFSLSLSPATLVLAPGGGAEVAVNVERGAGFTAPITLTLVAPPRFNGTFSSPHSLPPRKLRLSAAPAVAAGNYHVVVKGTGSRVTRSVTLRVWVLRR